MHQKMEVQMSDEEKLKFFESELDSRIKDVSQKRKRDKTKAFSLKIFAVIFAAAITMLLGLKVDDTTGLILQNLALMLGAIITILNAVEAFYDHRSLWIRRTVTLASLYDLRRDLSILAIEFKQGEFNSGALNKLMNRYDRILANDLKAWLKMREDNLPGNDNSVSVKQN